MPPRLTAPTRRQQYSSATRKALLDAATHLFTKHGYAATSLDRIVAEAKVTKGALYHHFSGKRGIFEAVFERVEKAASKSIRRDMKGVRDPWAKATAGLQGFLMVVQQPAYRRVVIQDGPATLGYERFREQEERSAYQLVVDIVHDVLEAGGFELDDQMTGTFARIFMGALSAAGQAVNSAQDPRAEVARIEAAIGFILSGLRSLAESGVEPVDPAVIVAELEAEETHLPQET